MQLGSSIQGKYNWLPVTVDSLKAFPFFGIGGSLLSSLKSELPIPRWHIDGGPISEIIAKLEQEIVLCS